MKKLGKGKQFLKCEEYLIKYRGYHGESSYTFP